MRYIYSDREIDIHRERDEKREYMAGTVIYIVSTDVTNSRREKVR